MLSDSAGIDVNGARLTVPGVVNKERSGFKAVLAFKGRSKPMRLIPSLSAGWMRTLRHLFLLMGMVAKNIDRLTVARHPALLLR